MLTVSNVSLRLGDLLLFENVNFNINSGDRIGLVGPNGAGKSSLLRIITGELPPTTGSIWLSPGERIGYLRQGFADVPGGTLADVLDIPANGLLAASRELDAVGARFADPDADMDAIAASYQHATDTFEARGGYGLMSDIEALLDQFGLGAVPLDRPVDQMSGGQKTRAGLAALLATRPNLLILDEPTNHLDEGAMAWLKQFLNGYQGAFIIVSHDRAFLDNTVNEILTIDPVSLGVRAYAGNYSSFAATRAHERSEAEAAWHRQQVEVDRIKRDIRAAESNARSIENNTIDFAIRKKAAKIARPAVVRKKKLEKRLASEDAASRPERTWGMAVDFAEVDGGARDVVVASGVDIAYDDHKVLRNVSLTVHNGDRIAITGENGSGKTTLMRALGGELTPDTGSVRHGPGVKVGYFSQEQETLNPALTVMQQAAAVISTSETTLRNELHRFLFGGETVHKLVGDLSYGERSRLMLALLVLRQTTLLLLDEPLNHLDIDARESFEQALLQFRGTILMVLHDRYAIDRLATREWLVANGRVIEDPVRARA
jgi:ATP-binding cassette subfamily F protein 3